MFTKKLLSIILCLCITVGLMPAGVFAASAEGYPADTSWYTGESADEFTIANAGQLAGLAELVNTGGVTFDGKTLNLSSDVDLGEAEWAPIGNSENYFYGTFNGNNHIIEGLSVTSEHPYTGLFGALYGKVCNLKVSGSISCETSDYIGSIAGMNYGTIINCISDCALRGNNFVSGIAGGNNGNIVNCCSIGSCSGNNRVNGISGSNGYGSKILNCYSACQLQGNGISVVCGITGINNGTITNAFWLSSTASVGTSYNSTEPVNLQTFSQDGTACITFTAVDGTNNLLAILNAWVKNNKTTYPELLKWREAKSEEDNNGLPYFDTSDYWTNHGDTSWYNASASRYEISTAEQLAGLAMLVNDTGVSFLDKTIVLANNINLSAYEWVPICHSESRSRFGGDFDGNGHSISGLSITTGYSSTGFFGELYGNVKNLSINANINVSLDNVGIIAGTASSINIENCSTGGSVNGGNYVGGIVGRLAVGSLINSYNKAAVTGAEHVGGLVGESDSNTIYNGIRNCYNTGSVYGSAYAGGIAGSNKGNIHNCYNAGQVAGQSMRGSVCGLNADKDSTITNTFYLERSSTYSVGGNEGSVSLVYAFTQDGSKCTLTGQINNDSDLARVLTYGSSLATGLSRWRKAANEQENNGFPVFNDKGIWSDNAKYGWYNKNESEFNIKTAAEFAGLAYLVNSGNDLSGKTVNLVNSIDMSDYEWLPIGHTNTFAGTFNGNGNTISGVSVYSSYQYIGLFGNSSGTVKNINLDIMIDCENVSNIGGVVGFNNSGRIEDCIASGTILGANNCGGITGNNNSANNSTGTVSGCVNRINISAKSLSGGIAGENRGIIINCGNQGEVTCSNSNVSGITSVNYNKIINCYNTGKLSTFIDSASGITCSNTGTVSNCYTAGHLFSNKGSTSIIGGENKGTAGYCFALSGSCDYTVVTVDKNGDPIANPSDIAFFSKNGSDCTLGASLNGTTDLVEVLNKWVSSNIRNYSELTKWRAAASDDENGGYPLFGTATYWSDRAETGWYGSGSASSFTISTENDLAGFALLVNNGVSFENKTVTLRNDLNMSELKWIPIGYSQNGVHFAGTFNGNNKRIRGIKIQPDHLYSGLFGILDGTVKNLVAEADINAESNAGIIAGLSNGSIYNCVSSGSINGGAYIGGIAGINNGSVLNCYNIASVSGNENIGGIAGINNGGISNCHSSADVSGSANFGGITGYNTETVSNGFVLTGTCANILGLNSGDADAVSFFTANTAACTLESAVNGTTDLLTVLNNGAAGNSELSEWRLMNDIIFEDCLPVLSNMYQGTETIDGKEYFLIYNASDIAAFAQMAAANSSVNAKLAKDIDFNGAAHTTIANFNGIFLGNGHTIKNFTINTSSSYTGFFGKLGSSAKVSGLTLENCRVTTSGSYAGLICGQSSGQIYNCHAIGGNVTSGGYAGGLVGYNSVASGNYFRDCTSSASVNVSGSYAGGLIGYNTNGTIINCRNSGGILCTGSYVGGIAGKSESGEIANCANLGNILCTGSSSARVGGILGENSYTGNIAASACNTYNCYNAGYVKLSSSSSQYVGGIIGTAAGLRNGIVKNCYWLDGTASKAFYLYVNSVANTTVQTFTCSGTSCTAAKENDGESDLTRILNAWVSGNNSSHSNLLKQWSNAQNSGINLGKPVNASDIYAGPVILEISVSNIVLSSSGFSYLNSNTAYSGEYILNGKSTSKTVTVNGASNTITLDNLDISASSPFSVTGSASPSIILKNENKLNGTSSNPALSVGSSAAITISGTGKGSFISASSGAGIGSTSGGTCGEITINGGTIEAISRSGGAGIGGNRATVTINGGTVNAAGYNGGAGIGGASGNSGGTITINGGTVNAVGYNGGAGIGGGRNGSSGKIKITNGTIKAEGSNTGAYQGSDIGNGYLSTAADSADNYISISGGNVLAVNGNAAPQAYSAEYYGSSRQAVYPVSFDLGIANANRPVSFSEGIVPDYYGTPLTLNDEGSIMLWLPIKDYGISTVTAGDTTLEFNIVSDGSSLSVNYGEYYTFTYVVDGAEYSFVYSVGATIARPEIPEIAGYTFERWIPEIPDTMPNNDVTVVALMAGGYVYNGNGAHIQLYIPFEYSVVSDCSYTDETVPPTDTEPGYTLHTCSLCSHSYSDNEVPALGHDFDSQWHYDEFEHWHECSRCDQHSEQSAHVWEWVEDTPATCVQTGIKHEECSICHIRRNENTVSSINNNHPSFDDDGFCTVCRHGQEPVLHNNYYQISNIGQLYRFAEMVNEGENTINAMLMNDIVINKNVLNGDMSLISDTSALREWSAMSVDNPYLGTFDGNGFSISGLYSDSVINYNGFFSQIGTRGVVKNLTFKDSYIRCNIGGGALCGQSSGTIQHCYVNANVAGKGYVGGIVGTSYGTLTNCGANICLNSETSGAGGIVCMADGVVSNCFVTGKMDCTGSLVHPAVPMSSGNIRISNVYYLNTLSSSTAGIGGTGASYDQFKSGEIAWLLNQSSSGNTGVWSQGRELPVFADTNNSPVYKVTYAETSNGTLSGEVYLKAGETVTVSLDGMSGDYSCTLYVNGTAIEKNTFAMPHTDCTVSAQFTQGGTQIPWGMKIIADKDTVNIGETLQLNVVSIPSNGPVSVTWMSEKPAIATVSRYGVVKGIALGNASITAKDSYGNTYSFNVVVSSSAPAVRIFSVDGSFSKKVNMWKSYSSATMELDFFVYNCNDAVEYKWFSSNPDVNVKNGHITNTGWFSRSSKISLIAYDAQGNIIAKDTVKVSFYKFSWQARFMANSADAETLADTPSPVAERTATANSSILSGLFAYVLNVFKLLFANIR